MTRPPASSTAGSRSGIGARQTRQRPRRSAKDSSGMLSYHARTASHVMQADRDRTTGRRNGIRAARTPRKLPIARPGSSDRRARAGAGARAIILLSALRLRALKRGRPVARNQPNELGSPTENASGL